MSLIGKPAPDFTAQAVLPDNSIKPDFTLSDLRGNYVVLFFYPLNFTFVCPTEILEFNAKLADFRKRGVEVVGVSVDSPYSHLAWKHTPVGQGGIGSIQYPLVSDLNKTIARDYDVLLEGGIALRGTFLIDRDGIVRHAVVNDLGLGRNVDEELRMVDALQHLEIYGEVCPANWKQGQAALKPTAEGVASYLKSFAAKA